jgi:hypothetical protein
MRPVRWTAVLLLGLSWPLPAMAADEKTGDGFVPMFDGMTLKDWVNVNCAPKTFFVNDSEIVTTGKPTGFLRTKRQYENFIAEFDWMHVPPQPGAVGNSGFFVWADPIPAIGTGYTRGIEVQVLVNLTHKNSKGEITATSQGDLFSIWGATCVPDRPHPDGWARCLPSENHTKGEREWNHYRVAANNGRIALAVNGHEVSGVSECKPRKGYLALESEGSECHFRNLKIKELPSTNPKADEVADEDKGFKNLYTGLDLSGWQADDKARKHWQSNDWMLHYDGKGETKDAALRTDKDFGNAEFIVDFRFPSKESAPCAFIVCDGADGGMRIAIGPDGETKAGFESLIHIQGPRVRSEESAKRAVAVLQPAGQWNRLHVALAAATVKVMVNGKVVKELNAAALPRKGAFALRPAGEMDYANLFVREVR